MLSSLRVNLYLCVAIVATILSGCQPIRPSPALASTGCTDQQKREVVQAFVDGVNADDAQAAIASFTDDAVYSLEIGPRPDLVTGKYVSPGTVEMSGHEEIAGLLQFFIDVGIDKFITAIDISDNTLLVAAQYNAPNNPIFGTPAYLVNVVYEIEMLDCQIARLHMAYPEEQLAAFVEEARKLDAECSDTYKAQVFQQYLVGINNADLALALLPFADNALAEYNSAPVFDAATQAYVRGEPNQWPGREDIQQVLEYFISAQFAKTFDPAQFKISGQTLTAPVIVSSPSFANDFALPLTDLDSIYTVEFGENCRIAHLQHMITDEALVRLKEAKP